MNSKTRERAWLHSLQHLVLKHSCGSVHVIPGAHMNGRGPLHLGTIPKGMGEQTGLLSTPSTHQWATVSSANKMGII